MAKLWTGNTFKRLRNRYRLVIMNDDTYEEVTTFKLSRMSVYIAMSTLFVLLVGLTIAIVSFTPLKFLIPGYGKQSSLQELRILKLKTDSMETSLALKQQYLEGLRRVLQGDTAPMPRDTTLLNLPKVENELANPD
ncbi:MAG: hypothetical protein EAY75_02525 [Bacteroidetes bacterium]|nr:MAG: hypothetical protein EAY75_02525 [Bacteroidota bacterium]